MGEQKQFDDYFNEVFDADNAESLNVNSGLSPMARKLKERKKRNIVANVNIKV